VGIQPQFSALLCSGNGCLAYSRWKPNKPQLTFFCRINACDKLKMLGLAFVRHLLPHFTTFWLRGCVLCASNPQLLHSPSCEPSVAQPCPSQSDETISHCDSISSVLTLLHVLSSRQQTHIAAITLPKATDRVAQLATSSFHTLTKHGLQQ
jgi:hypothetical protein